MDLFRSVDIGKAKHEGSIHVMHPPRARLHVFEGKLTPENKEDKAIKNIRAHPFACRVEAFLPVEGAVSPSSLFMVDRFFLEVQAPVTAFLEFDFITALKKKKDFAAVALGGALDRHNLFAVSKGKLHLSVQKDLFEQLGLEATKKFDTYHVEIDLIATSFIPGKPLYDRVKQMLSAHSDAFPSQFRCTEISSENASIWTKYHSQIQKRKLSPASSSRSFTTAQLPISKPEKGNAESFAALYNWIGGVTARIPIFNDANAKIEGGDFISTFAPPTDFENSASNCASVVYDGFLTWQSIEELLGQLSKAVLSQKKVGFLNVIGFVDSPISFRGAPRGFLANADSNYSIVLFPDETYIICI